jgi:hypothetical protein
MRYLVFLLIISLLGCEKIIKKAPNESIIYQEKIEKIDWNSITMYPAMQACDTIIDKDKRGSCFFKTLNDTLEQRLIKAKIYSKKDSILFDISISNKGILTLKEVDSLKIVNDSLLQKIILNFPKIEPAHKQGIFVNSNFQIKIRVRK